MKTVMFGFTLVITEGISHAMDDDSNKSYSKEICKSSLPLPLLVMRWFMVSDRKPTDRNISLGPRLTPNTRYKQTNDFIVMLHNLQSQTG